MKTTSQYALRLLITLTSALLFQVSIASAQTEPLPEKGLCAHRGDQGFATENTVPAFVAAAKAGAQQVELDVQKTKDGKLVIMHDLTVDRTTTGKGAVKDLTFDEIRSFEVKKTSYCKTSEPLQVPTFEEALDCLPRNIWINVHVKPGEGIAEDSLKVVQEKDRLHQAIFAVGKKEMESLRALCPEVKICCMERQGGGEVYIQNAINWKCDFIQLAQPYTPEQIARLKAAGVKINYFGTDDYATIRKMLQDGVDFPLVNYFAADKFVAEEFDWYKNPASAQEETQGVKLAKRGLCAHRGDQRVAPENTIPAFEAAAKAGAQQVELDVQLTKDGKLVIMHDLTVDRTTTGKGAVKDLTFDEIRSFDAGVKYDPKFAGTKVPTFEEALDRLPHNIIVNIHVKPGEGIAAAATKVVLEKGRVDQALMALETKKDLDETRAVCSTIKVDFLVGDGSEKRKEVFQNVIDWKCDFVQFVNYDKSDVEKFRRAGVTINFFGTDDPEKIRTLLKDGIDFPLVDGFSKAWSVADEFGGFELNQPEAGYLEK